MFNLDISSGRIFADSFEIISEMGRGDNSGVYLSKAISSDNSEIDVVLKIFQPPAGSSGFAAKFLEEAARLSALDHPNITKLLDFGEVDGYCYLASEFVEANSLEDYLENGLFQEESAVLVAEKMTKAFEHMDNKGIVHRDVKPDNILVADEDRIILVNFDLVKEDGQKTLSTKGDIAASPHFMPPELVIAPNDLSVKSDIYSLGATLYYIVSGVFPFDNSNVVEIIRMHIEAPLIPLNEVAPEISQGFSDIVLRMMEKKPEDRCSLIELGDALAALSVS